MTPGLPRACIVTIPDTGVEYGMLEKAQRASGEGVTGTVRTGLQLVAASQAYATLRQLRGKVRFSKTLSQLKAAR